MRSVMLGTVVLVALAGCTGSVDPKFSAMPAYSFDLTAADFVAGIDHPYLPLLPGATWTYYVGEPGDFDERIEVVVQSTTKDIQGVQATVVRDTVYDADGSIIEDTYDWYGQDTDGNIWYLGEDTCEYEDGQCASTGGSFEWGKDGALPGIVLVADPQPGNPYYQEYFVGEAMDRAQVIGRDETIQTALGTFRDTVHTLEWTPLNPGVQEHVYYARGVGPIVKGEQAADGRFDQPETLYQYDVPGHGSGGA